MSSTRSRSSRRTNQGPTSLLNLDDDALCKIANYLKSEGPGPASGTLTSRVYYVEGQDPVFFPVQLTLDKTAPNGTKTTNTTRNAFAKAINKQNQLPPNSRTWDSYKAQSEILKSVYGDPNSAENRGNFAFGLTQTSKDLKPLYARLRPRTEGRFDPNKTKYTQIGYHGTVKRSFKTVPIGTRERGTRNNFHRTSKALRNSLGTRGKNKNQGAKNKNTKQGRKSMQNNK